MANTSPRHMPMFGNVHPIKIEFLIDKVPMKNIWKKLSVHFF